MSTVWNEETRQAAVAAGVDVAKVEHDVAARAAADAAQRFANQRAEVMRRAFSMYYEREAEPGAIATWVAQNAGPDAASDFVNQWRADEGEYENTVPSTPDEWVYQQDEIRAQLENTAELIRMNQIETDHRRVADEAEAITQNAKKRNRDYDALEPLLLNTKAAAVAQAELLAGNAPDPAKTLDSMVREARAVDQVEDIALETAIQTQPFASTIRLQARTEGLAGRGVNVTADDLAEQRLASIATKAQRILAKEGQLVDELASTPMTEAEETAFYAQKYGHKGRFGGGLVVTGGTTQEERDAQAVLNRSREATAGIKQIEARNRTAIITEFADRSEEASRTPHADSIPDARPNGATQPTPGHKTPKQYW